MQAVLGKNGIGGLTAAAMLLATAAAGCATGTTDDQPDAQDGRVDPERDDGPVGTECRTDADCDDLAFCNGVERCVGGTCVAAERRACDDGVDCTLDLCEEGEDSCAHTPDPSRCTGGTFCDPTAGCGTSTCGTHADCDDGAFCNGAETCGADGRCVAATPVSCEDGEACTLDRCDTATDTCIHEPRDADRDGFADQRCAGGNDCDDRNDAVHPGATEICDNGADDNCDTLPDCRDTGCGSFPACAGGTGDDGGPPPDGGGSGTGGDGDGDGRPPRDGATGTRDGGTGSGCGSVTFEGSCEGTTLVWCADGAVRRHDCAGDGETCGWQDDVIGYNCIDSGEVCTDTYETDCTDGVDNDCDWLWDCEDDDCSWLCSWCGDGTCDWDEDCDSCDWDCGACAAYCGDGTCDWDEDCDSCDWDCGSCW